VGTLTADPPAAPSAGGPPFLERRLCFVLGKGGAGKSTVAAALGLAAARRGDRTLVVEVAGQEHLSGLFRTSRIGHEEARQLAPGLFGISIDPERATEEYLAKQLRVRPLVEMLVRSRAFSNFTAAAPGLAELVTIGKIWSMATDLHPDGGRPVWDRLVVDCPATGHGLALLETAGNVRELAGGGPIRDQADSIQRVVEHPAATGIAVVARPDELSVTEALEALTGLRDRGLPVALAVLNAVSPARFADDEEPALRRAAAEAPAPARDAAAAGLRHLERQRAEDEHRRRLREESGLPVLELPAVVRRRFDVPALESLAGAAAAALWPGRTSTA
jgi:anion-transporting  ArsA/GET3 family ATPase